MDTLKSAKATKEEKKQAVEKIKETIEKRMDEVLLSQPKNQQEQDEKTQEEQSLKLDMLEAGKAYQATLPPVADVTKIMERIAATEETTDEMYAIYSSKYSGLEKKAPLVLKRKGELQKIKQRVENGEITTMSEYENAINVVDDEIAKASPQN